MPLQVYLLGYPRVVLDGEILSFPRRKALAVLAYLIVTGQTHHRDALTAFFWPNFDQTTGRAELRRQISVLKQALSESYLNLETDGIGIKTESEIWDDVSQMQVLLQACRLHEHSNSSDCEDCAGRLQQLKVLYRGSFMEGFTLPDSPGFDYWQHTQNQIVQDKMVETLETLAQFHAARHDLDQAIDVLQRLLILNPSYESAHRQLMRYYNQTGKRSRALIQYEVCAASLKAEFGITPDRQTEQLYEQIRVQKDPVGSINTSENPSLNSYIFPVVTSPFIGRDRELQQATTDIADPACQLVSLVGMAGIGKTRLATEICRQQIGKYSRIVFVPLATIPPALFFNKLAEQVQLEYPVSDKLHQQIINSIRNQRLLLVLDSFELHLDRLEFIASLLRQTETVQVIVTSRKRLGLSAEWVIEIEGLPCTTINEETGQTSAADRLFIQCAKRLNPGFRPDPAVIAQICQRLQGLPLALELTATWTRSLSCNQILETLQSNPELLLSWPIPSHEPHHVDLRSIFAQSWTLISTDQQTALQQLAIFPASFTQEAAQKIVHVSLASLIALVDHSLLCYDRETERFFIHSVLRLLLQERLASDQQLRQSYCGYFTEMVTDRREALIRRDSQVLVELGLELDNLQTALQWALADQDAEAVGQLMKALYQLFETKKWLQLGKNLFQQLTDNLRAYFETEPQDMNTARRLVAQASIQYAVFCFSLGQYSEAGSVFERYIPFWRSIGDQAELAVSLNNLGMVYTAQQRLGEAEIALNEAHTIREKLKNKPDLARTTNNQGICARYQGNYEQSWQFFMQSLTLYTELHDPVGLCRVCTNLGNLALSQEHYLEAQQYFDRCLKLQEQFKLDSTWANACTLENLGNVKIRLAQLDEAKFLTYRAYALFRELGHKPRTISALLNLAKIAVDGQQRVEAQRYLTEALQLAQEVADPHTTAQVLLAWIPILCYLGQGQFGANVAQLLLTGGTESVKASARTYFEELRAENIPQDRFVFTTLEQAGVNLLLLYGIK